MKTLHLTNPPQHGAMVLQSALRAARVYGGEVDGVYGPDTAQAVERAKWRLGYPFSAIHHGSEIAGDQLLSYLLGRKQLPLAYRIRRQARLHPVSREDEIRTATVAGFRFLIAREPEVHYRQSRPIPFPPPGTIPPGGLYTDCSGAVTIAAKWGGAPDPNGNRYNGLGFTGTLLANLPQITRAHAKPGDLVVFGPGTGDHVCMVLSDTLELGSHGQERGPLSVTLATEEAFHKPPTRYLSLL